VRVHIDEPVLLRHHHCETVRGDAADRRQRIKRAPARPARRRPRGDLDARGGRAESVLRDVGTATNGRAGIDAAATLRPDVIVLDMSMPGMTGLELAGSLREAGSTAVLIFFTVHQEQESNCTAGESQSKALA
jgi:CheY-like chemotaxis protein